MIIETKQKPTSQRPWFLYTATGKAKDGTTFTRSSIDRKCARDKCGTAIWTHNSKQEAV